MSMVGGRGSELVRTKKGAPAVSRSDSPKSKRLPLRDAVLLLAVFATIATGCHGRLPAPSSQAYGEYVSAFYTGLAALQVGDDVRADTELARTTQVVPGEPAGWANWGILALRQRNFDAASDRLEKARKLSSQNAHIYYLLGLVETGKGASAQAISDFRKAVELDPKNLIATYQLAEEIERQSDSSGDAEFQQLIQQIVQSQPNNTAVLIELARIAAKRGDAATLKTAVAAIQAQSQGWPPEVQQQFAALQAVALGADPHAAALRTTFLRNVLMRLPDFRRDLAAIKPQPGDEAQPFTHFLRMETPPFTPAPADTAMSFEVEQSANADPTQWSWIGGVSLGDAGAPTVVTANGSVVRIGAGSSYPFPGGPAHSAPEPDAILAIDFNYDFKTDLVLAGAGGVRFLRQDTSAAFTDVTAQTKLPVSVLDGRYTAAWAADIEADGDLDIILASESGAPTVLRNNGDGTFTAISPFRGVDSVRGFVWADLNGDGNPDATFIDGTEHLHVFRNERSGKFTELALPPDLGEIKAITAADASHSGVLDLLAVESTGAIVRLSQKTDSDGWATAQVASVPNPSDFLNAPVRLQAADLDNNGAIDLLLSRMTVAGAATNALLWLGDEKGAFLAASTPLPAARIFDVADIDADGRLDLLGLTSDGRTVHGLNHGTRNYHWQVIRPRALLAVGDQRINSFGVGGEIQIRSGLLVQLQPINGPQVHFGLGRQTETDVARIQWPNGTLRAEFTLKANQQIVTEQRLKGSCPFLFAYNGRHIAFVKDAVPWGSAIGLRIDNLGTASIAATEEWYKIDGSQLVPHDGYYDLRITGELWETYYYDYLGLAAVDHPSGTEIFTDERFIVPAAKPKVIVVDSPHKIARAIDDRGADVTDIVRDLDGRYLDTFGLGQYQGVTRDHYVELDLGDALLAKGPLYLIAKGWLHPSDSSVNVAISQGSHEPAHALSLEVPDGHGGWRVARPNLGFPAGRNKTCVIDIAELFPPGVAHRLRLRTNLEIYWDSIEWAQGRPDVPLQVRWVRPASADLHYRGYSTINQPNLSSPEIPDYNRITSTRQIWRDLEGYYTRYGDVRELLGRIDDRYVIMNAGDEMSLHFPAQPEPRPGWVRDYVIAGDGWIKDGDYNSSYSKTVLPLPHHDRKDYDTRPGRLEDEWVYRRHPLDWQIYHTRYVTPDKTLDALKADDSQ